ncbi:MAG TPA: hypothetical protein VND92_03755 [Vicinamibacterales bacterium]|nr:hypothetical protein [Vicinamibacterales bacterium]
MLIRLFAAAALAFAVAVGIPVSAAPATAPLYPQALYNGMRWRMIGPFYGGRVEAVAGVSSQPDTFYFGAVDGGVWKTIDAGNTWQPLFQHEPVASIGAMAVAPSDPRIIYVGTGEADPRTDISFGDGVYKSTDAGATWQHVGLGDTRHIGRILVDPHNPDVVLVAALGHVYGTNTERGVFRTTDGGRTWTKVLYKDDQTGAIDLAADPANPQVVYASLWQVHRTPWSLVNGGPGSGLYKSEDGGATWHQLEGHGLPSGIIGRISISVAGGGSHRVYALINAAKGGLYRSDDGGSSWQLINADQHLRQRPWYYFRVYGDPQHPDTVYVLNFLLERSTDGGKTFTTLAEPHVDNHALWIDPQDPQRLIEGNDGGATISVNGAQTWSTEENEPTGQFYHVTLDHRFPFYLYGAQQDRGTAAIASRSDSGAIGERDWYDVGGGESGYVVPDPTNPAIVYAGSYYGDLTRFDKRNGQEQDITPWPDDIEGYGADKAKYRFSWTSPVVFSPQDPHVMYAGAQVLLKTTNGGMSWQAISPDLTRNDKSKQGPSGGPITLDNVGAEIYDVVYTIAPSPVAAGQIWVGTNDGLIQLTRDGGKTWHNVTPPALPKWAKVSLIEASPFDAGTAYAAVDAHRSGDFAPYAFRTRDFGRTWTAITNGLGPKDYVHVVREDPVRKGLLFAGTEQGAFVSFDDGGHWQSLQLNLPTVSVRDFAVRDNDLAVATHGRGFWILDDITPLRQIDAAVASSAVHLYQPEPAYRMSGEGGNGRPGRRTGANPPNGAIINYYLASAPAGNVSLAILDAQGHAIRTYSTQADTLKARQGMNRMVWNLRYPAPPALHVEGGPVFEQGSPITPTVVPGAYRVRLTVDGHTYTSPLTVKLDPRVHATAADLAKQLALMQKIDRALVEDHDTFNQIAALRMQIDQLRARLAGQSGDAAVATAAEALDRKAGDVALALFQYKARAPKQLMMNYPSKLNSWLTNLEDVVGSADTAPTAQSYLVYQQFRKELDAQVAAWKAMQQKDLPALNTLLKQHDLSPLSATTATGAMR